jgi:CDP-diacylglycerol pyrophosphatase
LVVDFRSSHKMECTGVVLYSRTSLNRYVTHTKSYFKTVPTNCCSTGVNSEHTRASSNMLGHIYCTRVPTQFDILRHKFRLDTRWLYLAFIIDPVI